MNNNYRTLPDGSLLFVRDPPKSLPGFSADAREPNRFYPDFVECKYRRLCNYTKPCGKPGVRFMCQLLSREVNPMFCDSCNEVEV